MIQTAQELSLSAVQQRRQGRKERYREVAVDRRILLARTYSLTDNLDVSPLYATLLGSPA